MSDPRPYAAIASFCLAITLAAGAATQEIRWSIPEDGGTPRDPRRIEQLAPAEFRIRASFEEGGDSVLRHAASRVDLVCRNDARQPVKVTVHLDLSQDGQRTDYEGKPEAGMKDRDFAFIQPPGGAWKQIDGSTDQWVATVEFEAVPGETRFGLSPWYTYGDYLRFLGGLPEHPHLTKTRTKTDSGREHWELAITDPAIPPQQKKTIFWHAREHAYETFSSFAMEGLVGFLLSDEAAEIRRRTMIVLHPMTNVDGVAQGFEYRGGYDFPNPRSTTTGRLTFDAMDRLQPDIAITWHNWIMPRDGNVLFYADDEDGQPTPRAFWRMTQLLPSLHAFGHRWRDETLPLKHNWHSRPPANESNVHQYAQKRYGTRVWGWEMPWWNVSTGEARRWGRLFAQAFFQTLRETEENALAAPVERPDESAPQWAPHEFALRGRANVENPYRDAALVGEFTSPSGKVKVVDGFYDGGEAWRLRVALDEPGDWTYLLRGEGVEILERGKLLCTAPQGRGAIRIDKNNPYGFAHDDGTPFFPMGDTCYGLFDDSPITPGLRQEYIAARRSQHFNFVRMTVGHSERRAAADPNYWAWGGAPARPDLDRYNPEFFRRFDELVAQLRRAGMNIELILLNFYRKPYADPAQWTSRRERQWLRYLLARYGAYDNIFLWTIANEYETHPDGAYQLTPDDVAWAKSTARFIKTNDPHRHLVTIHPVVSASAKDASPRAPIDPPWRIGEFYGDDPNFDVLSQQTGQMDEGTRWDETLQAWEGDSATVVESVARDRRYRKPVLNSENGYEFVRGGPTARRQVHSTDKVRRTSWRIVCGGGYFAAGFRGTLGHSDAWNRIDAPNNYPFDLQGEGAAEQLALLYEFFAARPFERLQPWAKFSGDAEVLAEPGRRYVAYLPHGGELTIDLGDAEGELSARWFNPRNGDFVREPGPLHRGPQKFASPDSNDWTLLVELAAPAAR